MNTATKTVTAGKRGLPAWLWGLIGVGVGCVLLLAFFATRFVSAGLDLFKEDAIIAMRSDPIIVEYIGEIKSATLDVPRSGTLPGGNEFAFRVEGARGAGIVEADFVTTLAGERLGKGVLRMDDGKIHALPGTVATEAEP